MTAGRLPDDRLRSTVERARSHDPDAWEDLYRHAHARLFTYARRRLPNDTAADDAVSETFTRALEGIRTFDWQGAGFDGWVYGILRNVVLEALKRPGRADRLLHRQMSQIDLRDRDADPVMRSVERAELSGHLRAAFDRLSEADRELLELRIVGELSAEDVGHILGKRAGAVRTAQSRALERLRAALGESADA